MADRELPTLRNDSETLRERMNDNAYENVLPARYLKQNENGELIEEQEDLFERVAKNLAVAEACYTDEEVLITPDEIKPEHPRREKIIGDVFNRQGQMLDGEVSLTEENAKWVAFDQLVEVAPQRTKEQLHYYANQFQSLMKRLAFMPNSPTLMNAGDELQQLSACFVISPEDDIDDIHQTAKEAAQVFQSGGGMGYGFWDLRPYGDPVGSTGGIASGPITFMRTYDQMCETIAQGGARRGAQMGVMRVSHPDVIQFIHAKNKDVALARTLRLNDPDDFTHTSFADALEEARELIDDEGRVPEHLRNAVEGHLSNFNISVGLTGEFMKAVKNGEEFTFTNPRTGDPHIATPETKELYDLFGLGEHVEVGRALSIPAEEIWEDMVEGAHQNGEPGVVFLDKINEEHSFDVDPDPYAEDERQEFAVRATNPCVTGDTLVATADGRGGVPIENLTNESDVPVYTRVEDDVEVALAENIRKTRENASLVEVETDGEVSLRCTEDHPIWTLNRGWVDAGDLSAGDRLHMLYENEHNADYRAVSWTGKDTPWNLEHRMVAKSILGEDITDLHVHHRNSDKTDNRPENLGVVDPSEHGRREQKKRRDMSEHNPVHVLKERGEFEEYKQRNSFYDTEGENNSMAGERVEVTCHECGETFKSVTNTHLESQHDMTTEEYKQKYPDATMVRTKQSNHVVTGVSSAGSEDVYDLEVPGSRNFYAGNSEEEFMNIHNCGEQPLMEYEACNLGHVNLSTLAAKDRLSFEEYEARQEESFDQASREVKSDMVSEFLQRALDTTALEHRARTGARMLDNVVTMSNFPVDEIEETVRKNRKTGVGIMGLAQLFVQLGLEYGSEEADLAAEEIMRLINKYSSRQSQRLANKRGVFENWEESKFADADQYEDWISRHTGEANLSVEDGTVPIRNHNTTTIAPTGTTSMVGNTSGGCEPIYSVANYKNVSDDVQGDDMLVQFDSLFLQTLEENNIDVEATRREAIELMENNEFDGASSLSQVPDEIAELFVTTGELSAKQHASIQCALQNYVDSAISKTVNAPNEDTLEDTKEAFEYVYENGGKGVTYYRDGTRTKQVKTTRKDNQDVDEEEEEETAEKEVHESESEESEEVSIGVDVSQQAQIMSVGEVSISPQDRPDRLRGETCRVQTGYGKMYVTVNFDGSAPFEVFATIGKSGGVMESACEAIARLASLNLRSGVDVSEVIDQLEGIQSEEVAWHNEQQINSIADGIAYALKQLTGGSVQVNDIPREDEEIETVRDGGAELSKEEVESVEQGDKSLCPECGSYTLIQVEGCNKCESCGYSKC